MEYRQFVVEFNQDQRQSLASFHLARIIANGSAQLHTHLLTSRIYNLPYPPEVLALLDDKMVRIQTASRKSIRFWRLT